MKRKKGNEPSPIEFQILKADERSQFKKYFKNKKNNKNGGRVEPVEISSSSSSDEENSLKNGKKNKYDFKNEFVNKFMNDQIVKEPSKEYLQNQHRKKCDHRTKVAIALLYVLIGMFILAKLYAKLFAKLQSRKYIGYQYIEAPPAFKEKDPELGRLLLKSTNTLV